MTVKVIPFHAGNNVVLPRTQAESSLARRQLHPLIRIMRVIRKYDWLYQMYDQSYRPVIHRNAK